VQRTVGILRHFWAFSTPKRNPALGVLSTPAPPPLTQTVGRLLLKNQGNENMKKIPWMFFLVFGLFIIYFFVFIFPSVKNSSDSFAEGQTTIEQGDLFSPFRADISIVPPKLDDENQGVSIELHEASFYVETRNYDTRIKKVCIDSLTVITRFQGYFGSSGEQASRFFENENGVCKPILAIKPDPPLFMYADIYFENEPLLGESYMENNSYNYPYDGFSYETAVYLKYRFIDEKENVLESGVVSPYTIVRNEGDVDWDRKVGNPDPSFAETYWLLTSEDYIKYAKENPIAPQKITYSRPLAKRIVYLILLLSVLTFIAFLTTTSEVIVFVEGASAILFGIYGIRGVIVSDISAHRTTIIDSSILGLYLVLSFATAIQLFRFLKVQFFQNSKNALSKLPSEKIVTLTENKPDTTENVKITTESKPTVKKTKGKATHKK
jgi:hypothetical protein